MAGKLLLLVLSLGVVDVLPAQEVSGALEGRVATPQGQAIEDAEITVSGPALQGGRTALTDPRGRFTLRSLPAGSYAVDIRCIGYIPVRLVGVLVRLGSTSSLGDVHLKAQAIGIGEIVVVGTRPVIDPVSPATTPIARRWKPSLSRPTREMISPLRLAGGADSPPSTRSIAG